MQQKEEALEQLYPEGEGMYSRNTRASKSELMVSYSHVEPPSKWKVHQLDLNFKYYFESGASCKSR